MTKYDGTTRYNYLNLNEYGKEWYNGNKYGFDIRFLNGKYFLLNPSGHAMEYIEISEQDAIAVKEIYDAVTDSDSAKRANDFWGEIVLKYQNIRHRQLRGLPPPPDEEPKKRARWRQKTI